MWLSSNNAGVTNPSASASRAGWYGEGGHDCCEAYQKDESSKVRELASESRLRASTCTPHPSQVAICGARTQADCAAAPKIRIDRAWLEFQLRNILAFRAAHDVPVWIVRTPPSKQPRPQLCAYDVPAHAPLTPHAAAPPPTPHLGPRQDQFGVHAAALGGTALVERYLDEVLGLFEAAGLHWTYWLWRRPFAVDQNAIVVEPTRHIGGGWDCGGFALVCQPTEGAPYQLNEPLLSALASLIR